VIEAVKAVVKNSKHQHIQNAILDHTPPAVGVKQAAMKRK